MEPLDEDGFTMRAMEVAALFRVDPKTITRWARTGHIPNELIRRTLGGHRRYHDAGIRALHRSTKEAAITTPLGGPARIEPPSDARKWLGQRA